jgi:predicted tellurium resistance membrane protein TerC
MEIFLSPEAWIALATLTFLEIVLGVDNIIFISVLVSRLPEEQRQRGRLLGLGLAMMSRIALLLTMTWMMMLTSPLFSIFEKPMSGRDLILIAGGLFLLLKAVFEIHTELEENGESMPAIPRTTGFIATLIQIAMIDIVFSLDSVITAVGMVSQVPVMVAAIVIAVVVMMVAAKPIGDFVDRHPTIKMLALSFLILVGVVLIGDGIGMHIPKGYIYFAIAFSVSVEMLNIRLSRKPATAEQSVRPIEEKTQH